MPHRRNPLNPFHSAASEVKAETLHEKKESSSYRLAFTDTEFLLREELRPIRFQLELLKPELKLQDENIDSTIVFFGSARIFERAESERQLNALTKQAEKDPDNANLQRDIRIMQSLVEKSYFYDEARKLAALVSTTKLDGFQNEFVVKTGGGPGLMEAANRGAMEAGAKSIGLNIVLPHEQAHNPYITPDLCFQFHYFALRKMHFLIRARALIALPGGFGTLDELFDTLTLLQTEKMDKVPVLLFGKKYWQRIINFDAMVEEGTVSPEDLDLIQYVETAEEAWQAILDFYNLKSSTK